MDRQKSMMKRLYAPNSHSASRAKGARILATIAIGVALLLASACAQGLPIQNAGTSPSAAAGGLSQSAIQSGIDALSATLRDSLTESLSRSLTASLTETSPQAIEDAVAAAVAEAVPAAVARAVAEAGAAVGLPAGTIEQAPADAAATTATGNETSAESKTAASEVAPAEAAQTTTPAESAQPPASEESPAESSAGDSEFVPLVETAMPLPSEIVGLGILGDSTQDEYQGTHYRGGDFYKTTMNWVELLARKRDLPLGEWTTFDEPRREGFTFNWARSGATSEAMRFGGQMDGVVAQCNAREVSHVLLQIGINDVHFSGLGAMLYENTISQEDLQKALETISDNIVNTAIAVRDTGACHILIAATQDYTVLPIVPEILTLYTSPDGIARTHAAFAELNHMIQVKADAASIPFFDFNPVMLEMIQRYLTEPNTLVIGGARVDLVNRGNDPHFGLLDDEYIHPGTVISGLFANVYINELNRRYGTAIPLLSDEEIIAAAGITP